METQGQIRARIYNALLADTALATIISDRLYWVGKPTITDTFPLLNYSILDTSGGYVFGQNSANSEDYSIQIDVYTEPSDVTNMDAIIARIKAVMTTQCFREASSPIEFLESDINKIVRPMRWEAINV